MFNLNDICAEANKGNCGRDDNNTAVWLKLSSDK